MVMWQGEGGWAGFLPKFHYLISEGSIIKHLSLVSLQELIRTIIQVTVICILTAESDPKLASFAFRENPGCTEIDGKKLLLTY